MSMQSRFTFIVVILFVFGEMSVLHAQDHASHQHHHAVFTSDSVRQVLVAVDKEVGQAKVIDVHQGEQLQLVIEGEAEEVYHLHGYNLMAMLNDQQQPVISFQADYTGRYPLVWHKFDELLGGDEITIAYIEVKSH